ncbi:hypothetical protein [Haploplasma axanthum]|uniref:Uncharacterized protein n=1 Tax=Haploplasma axanthum TaxID=29552 RepID=A0A449BDX0_HAPAX|nr:hypothetical protein [Haploplasma axanthum]VEU80625.1 Uncharacterised protein [Haploplasma axanthum]
MKFTKKMVLSVLTLVITVFALGTGVFAWFTINNTTSVSDLSGTVQSGTGGFLISTNGEDWNTALDLSGITVKGDSFTDLTSEDGKTFKSLNNDSVATGYIEFDLHFLIGTTFNRINLSDLTVSSEETSWKSDVEVTLDKKYNVGDAIKNYASNAARISIENQKNDVTVFEQSQTAVGNTSGVATETNNYAFIYYNALATKTGKTALNFANASALTTDGHARVGEEAFTSIEISDAIEVPSTITVKEEDTKAGYTKYAKITVRVWIEGWDGEAFNAILGGKLNLNFTFTAAE